MFKKLYAKHVYILIRDTITHSRFSLFYSYSYQLIGFIIAYLMIYSISYLVREYHNNTVLKGAPQLFYLGLSFYFMAKNGKLFMFFQQ